jgi:hypothetical protein
MISLELSIEGGLRLAFPNPDEVSSLGTLSVFLISYNLVILNDINTDLEMHPGVIFFLIKSRLQSNMITL